MRLNVSKKVLNELAAARIADFCFVVHYWQYRYVVTVLVILFGASSISGQELTEKSKRTERPAVASASLSENPYPKFEISERDLLATIAYFKAKDPKTAVADFRANMPAPVTNPQIRDGILRQLPAQVQKLKINDPEMVEKFRKVIAPVLEIYGRDKVYDILIFRHSTPIFFSDSGVVLVVSTGMIERIASDDEILGYVAHEVAHEMYAKYSIYSRYLLKIITEGGGEPALKTNLAEMFGLIELQCDAFAVLTLIYLDKNPLAFIEGLERIGSDFPNHSLGFHPPDSTRRRLIERIVPQMNQSTTTQLSSDLKILKQLSSEKAAF